MDFQVGQLEGDKLPLSMRAPGETAVPRAARKNDFRRSLRLEAPVRPACGHLAGERRDDPGVTAAAVLGHEDCERRAARARSKPRRTAFESVLPLCARACRVRAGPLPRPTPSERRTGAEARPFCFARGVSGRVHLELRRVTSALAASLCSSGPTSWVIFKTHSCTFPVRLTSNGCIESDPAPRLRSIPTERSCAGLPPIQH